MPRPATVVILHMASTFTGPSRKGGAAQVHGDLRGMQAEKKHHHCCPSAHVFNYWFLSLSCFYRQNFVQNRWGFQWTNNHPLLKNTFGRPGPPKKWPSTHPSARLELPEDLASNLAKEVGEVFQPAIFETLEGFLDDGVHWKCMEMHGNAWFGCKHRKKHRTKIEISWLHEVLGHIFRFC